MAAPHQSDEIWTVDSYENYYNCWHKMSDFEAKMHQNRFRLGLRPRPRWGNLQRFPDPPSWNKEDLLKVKVNMDLYSALS